MLHIVEALRPALPPGPWKYLDAEEPRGQLELFPRDGSWGRRLLVRRQHPEQLAFFPDLEPPPPRGGVCLAEISDVAAVLRRVRIRELWILRAHALPPDRWRDLVWLSAHADVGLYLVPSRARCDCSAARSTAPLSSRVPATSEASCQCSHAVVVPAAVSRRHRRSGGAGEAAGAAPAPRSTRPSIGAARATAGAPFRGRALRALPRRRRGTGTGRRSAVLCRAGTSGAAGRSWTDQPGAARRCLAAVARRGLERIS